MNATRDASAWRGRGGDCKRTRGGLASGARGCPPAAETSTPTPTQRRRSQSDARARGEGLGGRGGGVEPRATTTEERDEGAGEEMARDAEGDDHGDGGD
eukprot:5232627-Pyramimonas_sp.AAC.1